MCAALATARGTPEELLAKFQHGLKGRSVFERTLIQIRGNERHSSRHLHPSAAFPSERLLEEFNTSEADLKEAFAKARSAWIERDREGWLGAHDFFTTAVDAVRRLVDAKADVAIITTKGAAFTKELLQAANLAVPEERIFGLEAGKKVGFLVTVVSL
jgi:phosphoglycolate phosphatase-like HAD superfamily hydrolase